VRDRWKVIARLLSREFETEVKPSREGWGAGYDPAHLPLLEAWALGEVEDIPAEVKRPAGVLFNQREFLREEDGFVLAFVRHEIAYLLAVSAKVSQGKDKKEAAIPQSCLPPPPLRSVAAPGMGGGWCL